MSMFGILLATAIGIFTNFLCDILFPKIQQYQKVIVAIFAGLVGLQVALFSPENGSRPSPELLKILTAKAGSVASYYSVTGFSPFLQENHYLIAAPQIPPERYVASPPFAPGPDGYWAATVKLGSGLAGLGQVFSLQVLSTSTSLPEGTIESFPPGSHVSSAVNVLRTK